MSVPLSEAVASKLPSPDSANLARSDSWAATTVDLRASYNSTRAWPRVTPGHASTLCFGCGHRATNPRGFGCVSIWSSNFKSEKR